MPEELALADQLRRRIAASGPISVAEYMREANAAYYAAGDPFGAGGDFVTAPEISQMFGEMVGLWLADLWNRASRPESVHYVELGPGRGTLAHDALRSAKGFGLSPSVQLVETSAALRSAQRERLPLAEWHDSIESLPRDGPLLIVANEFFDALPVRQMIATEDGWRERMVALDGDDGFAAETGTRAVDALVPDAVRGAPVGSIYEHCPDAATILFDLLRRIAAQGGALLAIDYGYDRSGIGETLQAVKDHARAEPFADPGAVDLTAHVNFQELANIGRVAEMGVHGPVGQGRWLAMLGIVTRARTLASAAPDQRSAIAAALKRLTAPDEMGELFKLLGFTAPGWPTPEGFA